MRTFGSFIIGVSLGLFIIIAGIVASGGGRFADIDLLNPTTSAAEARRTYAEIAHQEALSQLELDHHQKMQEIARENERLRLEEERARTQARSGNEVVLIWAAFIVGAAALLALTAACTYYLITRARTLYPQAAGQLPRRASGAHIKIFPVRAPRDKAS
jgi:amino acid transporter